MAKANGLEIRVAAIYHDWFKDDTSDINNTGATPVEIERILRGVSPLPPGAIVQFDVEPLSESPLDLESGDTIPLPLTISIAITGPNGTSTDAFTPNGSNAYEGAQSKIKPGRFQKSNGYSGLIVLDARKTGPNQVIIGASGDGLQTQVEFPWYAKDSHK